MIDWDLKQRSPAWYEKRLGCATSSHVDDIVVGTTSDRYKKYRWRLIGERLSRRPIPDDSSKVMQLALEIEPLGRVEYQLRTGHKVREIGLATHPAIDYFSASTDGLVEGGGVLEIKCPGIVHHTQLLDTGIIDKKWRNQIWGELACTELSWCDFCSYCPEMPAPYDLWIFRVHRDDKLIRGIESEVICFLGQVEAAIHKLEKEYENSPTSLRVSATG